MQLNLESVLHKLTSFLDIDIEQLFKNSNVVFVGTLDTHLLTLNLLKAGIKVKIHDLRFEDNRPGEFVSFPIKLSCSK